MTDNGDTLYAWQVQEPDGSWSIIGAIVPGLNDMVMPLVGRSHALMGKVAPIAIDHARITGQRLRFAEFGLDEVLR